MSDTAPNMGLKYAWDLGTYFKAEMDANLKKVDRFYMPVLSATIGTPPGSPTNGDRYIIPNTGATGAWVGNETKVATYVAGAWEYDAPVDGLRLRDLATDEMLSYDSAAGDSSDGAWLSDFYEALKTNVRSSVIIDMDNADVTLTDAQAQNAAFIILNAGDGQRTITFPSSSDGKTAAVINFITQFAAVGFYAKSETYGGGTYVDAISVETAAYSTSIGVLLLTAPAGIVSVAKNYGFYDSADHYTLDRTDAGKLIRMDCATDKNLTIPRFAPHESKSARYQAVSIGAGNVTVTPADTSVSIEMAGGYVMAPNVVYTFMRDSDTDNWIVTGGAPIKYDGEVFYKELGGTEGVSPAVMFAIVPAGGFALSTAAGVQSCFPATSDVWTLEASSTYYFEGFYHIQKAVNSVSVAMAFELGGGASITSIKYFTIGQNSGPNITGTGQQSCYVDTVASTVVSATSATHAVQKFTGIIRMNAGGTVTPQIAFSGTAAGTPTMLDDSYIKFTKLGTNTRESVGSVQ